MNTQTPFFVFSVQREELSAEVNRGRVEFATAYMQKAGYRFARVCGRYRGVEETAFLVLAPDEYAARFDVQRAVMNLARLYEQESVLHVDANGQAALYAPEGGGRIAELGTWKEVSADEAASLDAVTEFQGRYWSAQA